MPRLPKELYTGSTFLSLGGATVIVWTVVSTILYLQPDWRDQRWIPLAVSAAVSFGGLAFVEKPARRAYLLAFFNTFLIFVSAVGANTLTSAPTQVTGAMMSAEARNFLDGWYH